MKINFMLATIGISFLTIIGILSADYYVKNKAIEQGLQQCVILVNDDKIEVVWTRECNYGVEGE